MHAGYDLWLPVASAGYQPHVFANYYSQPFVADFIGSSGKTTVQQLDVTVFSSDAAADSRYAHLAAYGAFEDATLQRVALTNLQYWNASGSGSGTARTLTAVDLHVPSGVASVHVDRLGSPRGAGADADSITYAGSQWTYASGGAEVAGVRNDSTTVDVVDGVATVHVWDSEAILVRML
jgi:hypothetical protein